jgi:hypothetical protein
MSILVQRVALGKDTVIVTVTMLVDGPVAPGESAGDYGSIDVRLATSMPTAQKVTAIKEAVSAHLAAKVSAEKLAGDLQRALDSQVVK